MLNLFKKKKCAMCGQKAAKPTEYINDREEKVIICYKCVPYAERRAFRRR
ncbi:hypothetical protein SAMN05216243_2810 [Sediminibacillus albus]|uniref:Uncharacterized protein n=1 Tax=Sediminibacillus albus TaxID=407036 RepID=A0A1G9B656_9BACI|nr:hypothetical protein SAMN05216243_2810 [Sediminibacillus albus]